MVEHCLKEKHAIALSLVDLSFWCYGLYYLYFLIIIIIFKRVILILLILN